MPLLLKCIFLFYCNAFLISNGICQSEQKSTSSLAVFFNNDKIKLENWYFDSISGDSFYFTTLKFYLGNFVIKDINQKELIKDLHYHLFDIEDSLSLKLPFSISKEAAKVEFNFGIDSLSNAEGIHSGDLDPLKGMYWIWQTGYIQFKMEGIIIHNKQKNLFEYHIGGFQWPNGTSHLVNLPCRGNNTKEIEFDISNFFHQFPYMDTMRLMSPGSTAKHIASLLSESFKCGK